MGAGIARHRGPRENVALTLGQYQTLACVHMRWKHFGSEPRIVEIATVSGASQHTTAARVEALRKRGLLAGLRVTDAGVRELLDAAGWV